MSGMQTALWHITIFVVTKFRCQSAERVHVTDWFIRSRKAAGLGEETVYQHDLVNWEWGERRILGTFNCCWINRQIIHMSLTCTNISAVGVKRQGIYTVLDLQMITLWLQTQILIFERFLLNYCDKSLPKCIFRLISTYI